MSPNSLFRITAALAGLGVVAWVGAGYGPGHALALGLTALIGAIYLGGLLELRRFERETAALDSAIVSLAEPPGLLADWLAGVPAALSNAVRRRIEGDPVALPGPALAPSLAGLLVLLGMLGTFLGMVLTLRGTGATLESAADLTAVRNALVVPVQGLGLAFGTSVAGVAASAALGLVSALCRRERMQVARRLDALAASTLRGFSREARQQQQGEAMLALMQRQADAMPRLAEGLSATMQTMQQQAALSNERLLASQQQFQQQATQAYVALAASVDHSLQTSLATAARAAAETVQATATHALEGLAGTFEQRSATLLDDLSERFERQSQALLQALAVAQEQLVHSAAEAPRAAAGLVAELREQLSASLVHDNRLLEERSQLMQAIGQLLDGVNATAGQQRATVEAQVASAAALHEQVAAGTIELASLGDAFADALQQFGESNDRLSAQLQRIEAALGQAMARSDDQLAYTVAQAREVIDLSLLSQKQIVEQLQRVAVGAEVLAT